MAKVNRSDVADAECGVRRWAAARRWAVMGLALAAAAGEGAAQSRPSGGADPAVAPYAGKYEGFGPFKKYYAELPKLVERGYAEIEGRLGLKPAERKQICVEVTDALPEDAEVLRRFDGLPFSTSWEGDGRGAGREKSGASTGSGGGHRERAAAGSAEGDRSDGEDGIQVTIRAEFAVNGRFDAETEVVHELTHAVMRSLMTREAYRSVPTWVREGLAVWTAGQVEAKAAGVIEEWREPDSVDGQLNGLEDEADGAGGGGGRGEGRRTESAEAGSEPETRTSGAETRTSGENKLDRYAEYGLAIEMIEKKHGADAVRALARAVVDGKTAREAVKAATKMSWDEFAAAARAYARGRPEKMTPANMGEYHEMLAADRARDYKKVIEKADKLLKAGGKSPLTGSVLYWRGKACRMVGKTAEAEKSLRELLSKRERASAWVANGLYQLGKARVEAEKFQEAIDPWQRILRDHPDSEQLDNVVYYLALCRAKTGKKAEAKRLLDVFERSFAGSEYTEKARALRAGMK